MRARFVAMAVLALALAAGYAQAAGLTDQYEILERHHEALGGLDRLKAETSVYFDGTFTVAGLEGTMKYWGVPPDRSRMELDLEIFKQTEGDNGEFAWSVDQNGKLQIIRDETAVKAREVSMLKRAYEHRDPDSAVFDVTFEGIELVGDVECYVLKTTNTIDNNHSIEFFNTETFLVEKMVDATSDGEMHTRFSDYRDVGGIPRAFRHYMEHPPIGQVQVLELTNYEAGIDIDPALFEPPGEDVRDFEFVDGGSSVDVPFEFIERHLFVNVAIDGDETLWVLDTGASMTVLDEAYAEQLGLETHGNLKGSGAGNVVEVSFTELPPYRVGEIRFEQQTVAVLDINSLFRQTSEMEIGGILGYDFLSRFVAKVDYANEMLVFYDPASFEYEGDGVILDAPLRGGTFTVPVAVDGEHGGLWSVDLGAGGNSFHYPYAVEHGLFEKPAIEAVGFGAGGRMNRRYSQFETIELAGFVLSDPRISIPWEETVGAFGASDITGNLGNTVFRHFVLYLDYERQRMIVEPGDDFDRAFPVDRSGLQFWVQDGEYEVLHAAAGTPADRAGFRVGDVLRSWNGIDVGYFDGIIAIRELLREEVGTEYRVEVLRDGKSKTLKLKLKDLF